MRRKLLQTWFVNPRVQVAYAVILIVVIVGAMVFNTQSIITRYRANIDVELQRKAVALAQVVEDLLRDDLDNGAVLQKKIQALKDADTEILDLFISVPEGENFRIRASYQQERIGELYKTQIGALSWHGPWQGSDGTDREALATLNVLETDIAEEKRGSLRFWEVTTPLHDIYGAKVALLTIRISLENADMLLRENLWRSYMVLLFTVLIVVLLLSVNTRLFSYASLYQKMREVDKMKDEFISIASHELRAPVTGIKGYISMLQDGSLGRVPKNIRETIAIIDRAASRLGDLVEDLLNVSRLQQQRLEVTLGNHDLVPLVTEVVSLQQSIAAEKKLALINEIGSVKLPKVSIDPQRMKQVLINLTNNAIKYTEKGSVTLSTATKNDWVEIHIKDTGIGMSAKDRNRLFEKFYRVKNKKTENVVGTGLGLWITKEILDLMRAEIWIDSIERVGTEVTVRLPIAKENTTIQKPSRNIKGNNIDS